MARVLAKALAVTSALGMAFTGCAVNENTPGQGGQAGGNQPAEGGSITVACGAMEDVCAAWTKAFTAKTGIKATFVRLSSGETVARLASAKATPEFDVWHGGPADGYGAAAKQDLLEKYESPNAKEIPEKYRDKNGYWAGVYVGALGFCSNEKVLKEKGVNGVPTSWNDLLDPKLKGQVSTAHPSTSGTAFTTLWTQVTLGGSEDAGLAYMKKMHTNVLQYTKSGTAPGQVAGRGEAAVGLVFSHDCTLYKEQGMPVTVSFPKEGTGYEVGGVAVVKNSKNNAGAKKYVDWALTAEAQDVGPTVGSYQVLTNPKAKADPRMAKLSDIKLVEYDFEKAAAAKKELTARFDAEVAGQPKG